MNEWKSFKTSQKSETWVTWQRCWVFAFGDQLNYQHRACIYSFWTYHSSERISAVLKLLKVQNICTTSRAEVSKASPLLCIEKSPNRFKNFIQICSFFTSSENLVLGMYVKLQKTEIILIITLFYGVLNNQFPHPLTLEGNQHFLYACHSCTLEKNEPT